MVPASFQLTEEIMSASCLTKPINGRAGQNMTKRNKEEDGDAIAAVPQAVAAPVLGKSTSMVLFDDASADKLGTWFDDVNEALARCFFFLALLLFAGDVLFSRGTSRSTFLYFVAGV
ncbi:trypanothione synthetase [Trypanosoma rangeli]|uniref:Trypanothione synthetase n=1 Tax=Trypanosoma rangeli TaxID=5698 RepID=A0A3S5ISP8_TRYRA|nr:trypanothione synthetase [Trypanosoma rangeli]RNF12612.1 trypanothione synthetase [Trypanosoma rangeli]|eukprot:RNF12612.1 trypanothione synthetase [Trypanosoma rangeli]